MFSPEATPTVPQFPKTYASPNQQRIVVASAAATGHDSTFISPPIPSINGNHDRSPHQLLAEFGTSTKLTPCFYFELFSFALGPAVARITVENGANVGIARIC